MSNAVLIFLALVSMTSNAVLIEELTQLPNGYYLEYNNLPFLDDTPAENINQTNDLFTRARTIVLSKLSDDEKNVVRAARLFFAIKHRHFLLAKDQVLIENPAENGCLKAFPQKFTSRCAPYFWSINKAGGIFPSEWSKDPGILRNTQNPDMLKVISRILHILLEGNLEEHLGVAIYDRDSLKDENGSSYIEKTSDSLSERSFITESVKVSDEAPKTAEIILSSLDGVQTNACVRCYLKNEKGKCTYQKPHPKY